MLHTHRNNSCYSNEGVCIYCVPNVKDISIQIVIVFITFHRIIVSLVAYFIIGAILMKVHFHASGSDIIPNKAFWTQFPLLIKVNEFYVSGCSQGLSVQCLKCWSPI